MIAGPGFAAAVFARDVAILLVAAIAFLGLALVTGIGAFHLAEALFGSVT